MVVSSLALNRLDDDAGDFMSFAVRKCSFAKSSACRSCSSIASKFSGVERNVCLWAGNPRPVEFWKEGDLERVGVRQRHRIARPAMECLLEVHHLSADSRTESPFFWFLRTFQSNAVLSAFSTASAPPETKKACGK